MNPSEEEVRAYLTDMAYQNEILSRAEAYRHAAAIFRAALALLDAGRKDRELLAGVQRVEMDMREDGERVCWDGVAGTFCFSDGTCHAESIAAMGLDIMRRDP